MVLIENCFVAENALSLTKMCAREIGQTIIVIIRVATGRAIPIKLQVIILRVKGNVVHVAVNTASLL